MKIGYFVRSFSLHDHLIDTSDYIKKYAHGGTEIAAYNFAVEYAKNGTMM